MEKVLPADLEEAAELLRAKIRVKERLRVSAGLSGREDPWQVRSRKSMSILETGKNRVERYILEVARGMNREDSVGTVLWWPTPSDSVHGGGVSGGEILRIYNKGTGWRSMEIARPDLDGCLDHPELLTKYESEVSQILVEL